MTSRKILNEKEVSALVITYLPNIDTFDNIKLLSEEFSRVLVVDNGSKKVDEQYLVVLSSLSQLPNVTIVELEDNFGIATALNTGIKYLEKEGYEWTVTFDQDSVVSNGYLGNLCASYNNFSIQPVIMGSRIVNRMAPDIKARYVKLNSGISFSLLKPEEDTTEVDIVITSGSLTSIKFIVNSGFFLDSYFIDYVDTEICLRAKSLGYQVALSTSAVIYHELGEKKSVSRFGIKLAPTNHSPFRRYYIARNSIYMYKKYGTKFPSWVFYDLVATCFNTLRILLSETSIIIKARYSLKGYFHGLIGLSGKMPD